MRKSQEKRRERVGEKGRKKEREEGKEGKGRGSDGETGLRKGGVLKGGEVTDDLSTREIGQQGFY